MITKNKIQEAAASYGRQSVLESGGSDGPWVGILSATEQKAFIAGAAWMQDQNQWIPVSQGLPEPHKRVEIWVSNQFTTCHLAVGFVNRGKQWHALYNNPQESGCYPMEYVTHYREIVGPKPPKP